MRWSGARAGAAKSRDRLAELARYYLRPIGSKDLAASRATLSSWRRDAAELVADELTARHSGSLGFRLTGLPRKGERLGLESLARDPAVRWILCLDPQERDIALHRGLADAAGEARDKADARTLIGVALIASRLAPETNPEPPHDFDGTPLRGLDGRKFTRSRLALPLVLLCFQRAALAARQPGQQPDRRAVLITGHRLVESAGRLPTQSGPLSVIDLHHPAFRSDSTDSVLFQLRFRREMLLLASHHDPGSDWRPELRRMDDLLVVRRRLLPAAESRRTEKVQLHLQQGIFLRQARELTAAGQPMDTVPPTLTEDQIRGAVRAIDDMIASMRKSLRIADQDADQITAVNVHRRKTEADCVVHLLSRVSHPDALAGARRLRRDLNRLDDVYPDQLTGLRTDVAVLWLLAMADQAIRHNETEQARHYLTAAVAELPEGIPHLAIRSASLAASTGETELAKHLVKKIPQSRTWPSYLKHLVVRLRSIEP